MEVETMQCMYGGECAGVVSCDRCMKCPYPVRSVKYPTERKAIVVSYGRWM
jgi:hypothetical protein